VSAATAVIGVGNLLRGDDGVGPAVAAELEKSPPGDTDIIVLDGEVTALIEAWRGRRLAVLVDAVATGSSPGTIHELVVGRDEVPEWGAGFGTHAAGLAEGVALARALDRLPDELRIVGVEPADVSLGAGLSPAVKAAVPELVALVLARVAW
jgi:hydrogenase maturation protease